MPIHFSEAEEVFTPLKEFLEEKTDDAFRQIQGYEYHQSGVITAKTTKLPNCVFNLRQALAEIQLPTLQNIRLYLKPNWTTILEMILTSSFPKVYIAILFLKTFIHSMTVEVTETDALVLYTLWDVANSGLPGRVIRLADFHKSARIANVDANALQQSFAHLEALKCIQVEADKIILTEQIVFERIYND